MSPMHIKSLEHPPYKRFLSDGVRPYLLNFETEEGYKSCLIDGMPVLVAVVSREKVFEIFMLLTQQYPKKVDVVFDICHGRNHFKDWKTYMTHDKQRPVVQKELLAHRQAIVDSGSAVITMRSIESDGRHEITIDDHKMIIVAGNLDTSEGILQENHIERKSKMKVITEVQHAHIPNTKLREEIETLALKLIG